MGLKTRPSIACVFDAHKLDGGNLVLHCLYIKQALRVKYLNVLKKDMRIFAIYQEVTKFGRELQLKDISHR